MHGLPGLAYDYNGIFQLAISKRTMLDDNGIKDINRVLYNFKYRRLFRI